MGMRAPVTGGGDGQYEQAPEGKYLTICNGVYMIGTQPGYQGGDPKSQLVLTVELHKRNRPAMAPSGRIYESSNIITNSFNEKSNLLAYAEAFLGRTFTEDDLKQIKKEGGFDPETLLGKCCWLDLGRKTSGKDKWKSLTKLDPEDDEAPTPQTDHVYWDWTMPGDVPKRVAYFWDQAQENPHGNFAKKHAQGQTVGAGASNGSSPNYQTGSGYRAPSEEDGPDIPF